MSGLSIEISDQLVDAIAERVLERLASRDAAAGDGWLRGAEAIADYIGAPRSRVYALHSAGRMPCVTQDGSALVAKRSELDEWVRAGGARRP